MVLQARGAGWAMKGTRPPLALVAGHRAWMPLVLLLVSSFLAVETSIAQTASSPSQLSDGERADFVSPPNPPTDVEIGVYLIRVTSIDLPSEPGAKSSSEIELLSDMR